MSEEPRSEDGALGGATPADAVAANARDDVAPGDPEVVGIDDDEEPTDEGEKTTLERTLDMCLFAPVGLAVTLAEDLPELISKGRERLGQELSNARIVGRFVVNRSGRRVGGRLEELLGEHRGPSSQPGAGSTPVRTAPSSSVVHPQPDAQAAAVVEHALADYDTLSASQVVRRLESLGPDELRAVQRYEASTRNRRTILTRAGQLLDEDTGGAPGT